MRSAAVDIEKANDKTFNEPESNTPPLHER